MTFFSSASFASASFLGNAFFDLTKFLGGALFDDAKFFREAHFTCATFSGKQKFTGEYATSWFTDASFVGDALFDGARFSGDVRFDGAQFSGGVAFSMSLISGTATFEFCRFSNLAMFGRRSIADISLIFRSASFEWAIDLNEKLWGESGFRLRIEKTDLASAADSYLALRKGFENMGHYRIAGELYYREMTCRKNLISLSNSLTYSGSIRFPQWFRNIVQILTKMKALCSIKDKVSLLLKARFRWSSLVSWFWTRLLAITCGFGERPSRVFVGCLFIVLIFSGLFFPIVVATNIWERLKSGFLLSIDAFTPGKFLNISYVSPGEWLIQIESVLGWFMLSLVLLVFTRKMSRG
jgi:hypothetical protein